MNVGVDAVLLHEVAKDVGVGGGYLLAVEPFQTGIVDLLSQAYTNLQPATI